MKTRWLAGTRVYLKPGMYAELKRRRWLCPGLPEDLDERTGVIRFTRPASAPSVSIKINGVPFFITVPTNFLAIIDLNEGELNEQKPTI